LRILIHFNFTASNFSTMKQFFSSLFILLTLFTLQAQNAFPFKKGEVWGYIDSTGKVIIEPQYPIAGKFYEGLAYAQIGEALGFIDEKGNEAIKSKWMAVYNFNEGYASVYEDEDWGFINTKGEWTIDPKFPQPMIFHNGLAKFKLERGLFSTYGFIDTKGDTTIYPQYEHASDFYDGLCMASKDGSKYGYVNTKGEWVIQPAYEIGVMFKINGAYDYSDKDFSNGYVVVSKENKYGLMDKTGKMVLECTYDLLGKYAEGMLPAKKGDKWGYINLKGEWVIKPAYDGAEMFCNGMAAVSKGTYSDMKYGFIDAKGKVVIPLKLFGNDNPFKPMVFDRALIYCYVEEGVLGYINREGKVVWKGEKN
jgi:hypothetical protein